jgi:glycerate kinase
MRIIVAPTSFKGSLGVIDACIAIIGGIRGIYPNADIVQFPISDGGDGFLESLLFNCGGEFVKATVKGPNGREIETQCGILSNGIGVVEMAKASGIALVKEKDRDPFLATSYGTGQLIKTLSKRGIRKIIVGIGGSATIDVGMGCLQALGVRFFDRDGVEVGLFGREISRVVRIDTDGIDEDVLRSEIIVAADVKNSLLGDEGAVYTYGKQKGLTEKDAPFAEDGVRNLVRVMERECEKDITSLVGGGAAGGIGGGLYAVCNATVREGIELFFEVTDYKKRMEGCDIIITGEGRVDGLTRYGKAVNRILEFGREKEKMVIVLAGEITKSGERLFSEGKSFGIAITPPGMEFEKAKERVDEFIRKGTIHALMHIKKWLGDKDIEHFK